MGALRVVFRSGALSAIGTDLVDFTLDGWKAELYILTTSLVAGGGNFLINGAPALGQLSPLTVAGFPIPFRLKFGGMTAGGRPVNMNQRIFVTLPTPPGAGNVFVWFLSQTYYDPTLTDPNA